MTVKEYKDWMTDRREHYLASLIRYDNNKDRDIGKVSAFAECINKCPDFFEMEAEKTNREAESRVQSITDKMENLKKQLKESKERADNGWERAHYLERKLKDVESLNDQLLRELARRQCKESMGE